MKCAASHDFLHFGHVNRSSRTNFESSQCVAIPINHYLAGCGIVVNACDGIGSVHVVIGGCRVFANFHHNVTIEVVGSIIIFQSLIFTIVDHVRFDGDKSASIYHGVRSMVGSEFVGEAVLVHEACVVASFVIGIPEHDISAPFGVESVWCLFPFTGRGGCVMSE